MEQAAVSKPRGGVRALAAGAVLQLFLGIIYVWSVFVLPVSEHFSWNVDSAKLTSSFMLSFFVVGILAGGRLLAKIGTRRVVLIGGLMLAAGMLLSSFVPAGAPWLIYVTYGIIGGFGVGMAYNTIITSAQKWFPKRRGLATGVSVFSFGFSTVVFAPLVEVMTARLGLMPTFRILAAVFCAAVLLLFSFITLPDAASAQAQAGALAEKRQYTTGQMLKTKQFYFIALSMMLMTAAYFILNPSFKTLALDRGVAASAGTALVMMTGICNALGRLAVPALSDKIGRENATLAIIVATALAAAALTLASGAALFVVVGVIAFCYGGSSGIYPLVTSDWFGIQNVGSNYGAVMVGFAASALLFPMVVNLIPSMTAKFLVLAAAAALGAVMILLLKASKKEMDRQ